MSTNKLRFVVAFAWPLLVLSAVVFVGMSKIDQHADCRAHREDPRYGAGRCLELNTTFGSKPLAVGFLAITLWAGYMRQRPTFPNVSLALLGDSSWNDFYDNGASLDGTAGTSSPLLKSDAKPLTAPKLRVERTFKEGSSISGASSTREHSDPDAGTEVELG